MAEYDQISGRETEPNEDEGYNGQKYDEICAAFQQNCRLCEPELALRFALEAYFNGGNSRMDIINKLLSITVEDKGLANTSLFIIVFQLIIPLLTRLQDETSFIEEKSIDEEWRDVKDFPDYTVSELGKFKDKNGKFLIVTKKEVYNYVMLEGQFRRTDALVAKSFLDKRSKGLHFIEHIDGDRTDDSYENLRWVMEEPGENKKKRRSPPPPFEFFAPLKYDELSNDPDRLSYIYRFALAVWVTAVSASSKTNAWATLLFPEIKDELDTEQDYIIQHGSSDDCKSLLIDAMAEKNLYLSLYYSKLLHYHPQDITETIKWTKEKKAYVYIWDAFSHVAAKAPNHVTKYLKSMRSLGVFEGWKNTDNSRLLYAHYIHMWCMDPITAYSTTKGSTREYYWGIHLFKGAFTNDFRKVVEEPETVPGQKKDPNYKKYPGRKILGKWSSEISVDEDEVLLFPINYPDLLEPSSQDKMRYRDPETGKKVKFPDFNVIFKSVVEGEITKIPRASLSKNILSNPTLDQRITHTILKRIKLAREDKKWIPLAVFYAYLTFYEGSPDIMKELEAVYGDIDDFFTEYNYPNPFVIKSDISKTEFLSFKRFIRTTLGLEQDEKNNHTSSDPNQRRHTQSKSTFVYRAVPSPIKRSVTAIEVTVNTRISPLKMEKKSSTGKNKGRVAKERIDTGEPSPLPSPYYKAGEISSSDSEESEVPKKKKSHKKTPKSSSRR
jgi:hypothetical protein